MDSVTFVRMRFSIKEHDLIFKKPGGTSRGVLHTKKSWILNATENNELLGVGECSLIQNLSPDAPDRVRGLCEEMMTSGSSIDPDKVPANFPSVKFGLEVLIKGIRIADPFRLYDNSFSKGEEGISINGLIWMGSKDEMFRRIKEKINEGFSCLKLKIGAIDFKDEVELLKYIRKHFRSSDIELRVDANGAFNPNDAIEKLSLLFEFDIHSIEQPIKPNQWTEMARLCAETPIPIALDEELIGIKSTSEKTKIIDSIQPRFIVLKPGLIGGMAEAEEWIKIATEKNVGWWVTSALESNIGLNAIAQWVASHKLTMPQGLGTGELFTNNIRSPLYIKNAALWYDPDQKWDKDFFSH